MSKKQIHELEDHLNIDNESFLKELEVASVALENASYACRLLAENIKDEMATGRDGMVFKAVVVAADSMILARKAIDTIEGVER